MKSTYDIQIEMEQKFGKDFIDKMNREKEEFEKLQKLLDEAKSFEDKVSEKVSKLGKTFVSIPDELTIYPDEICRSYLYRLAKTSVELDLNKEDEFEQNIKAKLNCLSEIEDDCNTLLKEIENLRNQVLEENK